MKTIIFYKLTGAGNDFILFDKRENPGLEITPDLASSVCSRRFGIGADGILLIDDSKEYNFNLSYFNADGSTGSLCGNGARCAIKYARFSGRVKDGEARFMLNENLYSGKIIDDDIVRFDLNEPKDLKQTFTIQAGGQSVDAAYVDTGSPHVVINIKDVIKKDSLNNSFYNDIDEFPVKELGSEIRYSDTFAPGGVNVNFILIESDTVKIRTYERGVEDETLACGTGAAASAIIAALNYRIAKPVNLLTRGGNILTVDFLVDYGRIYDLTLTGPAKIVFKGEITI